MDKYSQRLFEEWKERGNIIIAVDFDDTVSPWKLEDENSTMIKEVLKLLKECQQTGAYIVPYTTCNPDRYPVIQALFASNGILINNINSNPIPLPWGNESKIYANIYLDDRAGLDQACYTLSYALYAYRGYLASKNITEQTVEF